MTTLTQSSELRPAFPDRAESPVHLFYRNYRSRRTLLSMGLSTLAFILTMAACVPLLSVLVLLVSKGGSRLVQAGLAAFTETPPGALSKGGGFGNAIVGTLVMVGLASVIAVPFGVLAAIFLAQLGPRTKLAVAVRFAAKVMTGLPSILAGVFAYAAVVLVTGRYSAWAGGVALSVLMLPVVLLTAESAIKMVPTKMKEAAAGMGCTQAQVVWKVVVPSALPGILTGVMLAVARAAGETAPLLFTALMSDFFWPINGRAPFVHLDGPTPSLAVFIYNASASPFENLVSLAWAASLVLVVLVLLFNLVGQAVAGRRRTK